MGRMIVTAEDLPSLESLLVSRVAGIRESSPYGRIRVLAGSDLLCRHLARVVSERLGGHLNVEFLTFPGLLGHLESSLGISPVSTIPSIYARAVLEQLSKEGLVPEVFAPVARYGGFTEVMAGSLDDLSEGGLTAETAERLSAVRGCSPGLGGLLRLFAVYRRRIDARGSDRHSRAREVSRASRGRIPASGRAATGGAPLLAYGFYDMNEEQWDILEAAAGDGVEMFVPQPPGREGRFVSRFIETASRRGFVVGSPPGPGRPPSPVVEGMKGLAAAGRSAAVEAFSACDIREEARAIAARTLSLAQAGERFDTMAVLMPPGYDDRALREAFVDAGIPFYAEGLPLSEVSAGARFLLALAGAMEEPPGREALEDILMMPGPPDGSRDPMAIWIRISAEEGLTGARGWAVESGELEEKLRARWKSGPVDEDTIASFAEAAGAVSTIAGLAEAARGVTLWREMTELLAEAASSLRDVSSIEDDLERVRQLSGLDTLGVACDARTFRKMVGAVLSMPGPPPGSFRKGSVAILRLAASRGLVCPTVFLPGLTEDLMPGRQGRDPFLSDQSKRDLETASGGKLRFSMRAQRPAELELMLCLAAGSAGERLICSYPRRDRDSGAEKMPSSMLERTVPAATGEAPRSNWRLPAGALLSGERPPVDEKEISLLAAVRSGGGVLVMPGRAFFERGMKATRSRLGEGRLTAWDGVIETSAGLEALRGSLSAGGRSFSPTSLERWALCPFAYFIRDVLRLSPNEEATPALSLEPLQRGILVHAVMEALYRRLEGGGLLPLSRENLQDALEVALQTLGAVLEDHEPTGPAVFWEIEEEEISAAVKRHLVAEAREEDGFRPRLFEVSFGRGEPPLEFDTGERTVAFHGRIDRVDTGPGGRFRVTDYKTGKLRGKDDDLAAGTSLQLPVYLLAASSMLSAPPGSGEARYLSVSHLDRRRKVTIHGEAWQTLSREFAGAIDVIVGGIESGLFFPFPSGPACRNCDAAVACPTSRDRVYESKVYNDGRCAGFAALRGKGAR